MPTPVCRALERGFPLRDQIIVVGEACAQMLFYCFSLESLYLLFALMQKVTKKSRQNLARAGLRSFCHGSRTSSITTGTLQIMI